MKHTKITITERELLNQWLKEGVSKKEVKKLEVNKNKIVDSNSSMKTWLELIEDFLNTAFQIREIMLEGKPEQKQYVLNKIGGNYLIGGKKLTFTFKKPYDVLLKPEYVNNTFKMCIVGT